MAEFRGYECDQCEAIVRREELTTETVSYEGPVFEGRHKRHLCAKCAGITKEQLDEQKVTLTPINRRKVNDAPEAPPEAPAQSSPQSVDNSAD